MDNDKLSKLKLAKEYERGYRYGFQKGYRKGYHDGFDYGAETIISRNHVANKDSKSE